MMPGYATESHPYITLKARLSKPLKPKEEAMDKEYRILKPLVLADFITAHRKHHGCNGPWSCLCDNFRRDVLIWLEVSSHNMLYAGLHCATVYREDVLAPPLFGFTNEFIPHLIKYGFIEEVKEPERFYKVGDRFECIQGAFKGETYQLNSAGVSSAILNNVNTGARWEDPVSVKRQDRITSEEFDMIGEKGTFTLKET